MKAHERLAPLPGAIEAARTALARRDALRIEIEATQKPALEAARVVEELGRAIERKDEELSRLSQETRTIAARSGSDAELVEVEKATLAASGERARLSTRLEVSREKLAVVAAETTASETRISREFDEASSGFEKIALDALGEAAEVLNVVLFDLRGAFTSGTPHERAGLRVGALESQLVKATPAPKPAKVLA